MATNSFYAPHTKNATTKKKKQKEKCRNYKIEISFQINKYFEVLRNEANSTSTSLRQKQK